MLARSIETRNLYTTIASIHWNVVMCLWQIDGGIIYCEAIYNSYYWFRSKGLLCIWRELKLLNCNLKFIKYKGKHSDSNNNTDQETKMSSVHGFEQLLRKCWHFSEYEQLLQSSFTKDFMATNFLFVTNFIKKY